MSSFPQFYAEHDAALRDFWSVYDANQEAIQAAALVLARAHPVFGPLLQATTPEQMAKQNVESRERLRLGCVEGDWRAYEESLHAQGAMCAQMRIPFGSFYDLMRILDRVLLPALISTYGTEPERLAAVLRASGELFDHAMKVIAERYIEAKEEDRFRVLVDAVRDYAIFLLDAQGHVTSWNAGAQALKGYAPADIVGKHISVFYLPEERDDQPARLLEVARREGRVTEDGWRLRKDGTKFWANVVVSAIKDARGEVVAFAKVTRDLTERMAAEQALRASEENLSTTLHSIGDGVIATDDHGKVVRMNAVAEALTGWKLDDARGRSFTEVFDIVNERTGERAVNPVERVLREGVTVALANHTALVSRDGSSRPIADSAAPIRGPKGELVGVVLVFRDMTRERQAELAVREAHAFLDSIVENIPDMIFVKDAKDLRFVRFNRAGEELLGTKRQDLVGKSDRDFFPEDQAEFFVTKDRAVLAGKKLMDIPEEPIETKSGRRWLHTKKIPILDEAGQPRYLLGISEDITDRKNMVDQIQRMNEELEQRVTERTVALQKSEEQLRQSQKMDAVGRLAGGIAHDFNNLLSVILSYGEMMAADIPKGSPMQEELGEVRRAAQRAADLTRQLLAFSRRQVLAPKVTDLNQVLVGMDKMLARLIGEHIELRTLPKAGLGVVMVDPSQIEQVVMNLVLNARDAMPNGGSLTLETAEVHSDDEYALEHPGVTAGPHVMLAVSDSGVGMDKATRARIFEPFFTTKDSGKGTGLGLSMVHGIVHQSGGHVWVYSEVGKGTTFKIYFPLVDVQRERAHPTVRPSSPRGSETVLLVEDEEQVRNLARTVLKRRGYEVLDKDGPLSALAFLETHRHIDLLLTDVVMPKMSGRELAERVGKLRPGMKVLFMSGYTDDTIVRHGVLDSDTAFLQKPITPDTLARKVREVLDAQPALLERRQE